ncbi:MAG: hypothetical protein DCF31_01110 [Alphaproteobacteria bacterium]|nr:MAG: hypothetical protein DCF31_01110 [Alphaproteobacteria bacterium]
MTIFLKDPGAGLDYAVDWSAGYLSDPAVTIATSSWSVDPVETGGVVATTARIEAGRTIVTLLAGVPGRLYQITNQVTFSDGSEDERLLAVRVEDR